MALWRSDPRRHCAFGADAEHSRIPPRSSAPRCCGFRAAAQFFEAQLQHSRRETVGADRIAVAAKLDFSPLLAASTPSGRVNWAHPPEWSSHEAACPDRQELAEPGYPGRSGMRQFAHELTRADSTAPKDHGAAPVQVSATGSPRFAAHQYEVPVMQAWRGASPISRTRPPSLQ